MSFDMEPDHLTRPPTKEEYYEYRLRPVMDSETGVTIDEIDRMQLEIDMLKIDKEN